MSGKYCINHPDVSADATCSRCHSPICVNCVRSMVHGIGSTAVERKYCPVCYDVEVRKGGKWRWVVIGLFVILLISLSPIILTGILLLLYFMGLPIGEVAPI